MFIAKNIISYSDISDYVFEEASDISLWHVLTATETQGIGTAYDTHHNI